MGSFVWSGAVPTLFQIIRTPQFFFAKFRKKYARNIRVYTVITCDETWIFQNDPETKQQSMYWKSPQSPRNKQEHEIQSNDDFFRYPGGDLRESQTVNQVYYKNVLKILHEGVQ